MWCLQKNFRKKTGETPCNSIFCLFIFNYFNFRFFKDCTEVAAKAKIRMAVKDKCNEFMELIERQECIGEGRYGQVWTVKFKGKQSPLLVQKICKCMNDPYGTQMEAWILSAFYSKYVPKLLYAGYTTEGTWCTIMEYFTGGTLEHHIYEEINRHNEKKQLQITAEQKKYIAYHLALAIEEIHKSNFTHG